MGCAEPIADRKALFPGLRLGQVLSSPRGSNGSHLLPDIAWDAPGLTPSPPLPHQFPWGQSLNKSLAQAPPLRLCSGCSLTVGTQRVTLEPFPYPDLGSQPFPSLKHSGLPGTLKRAPPHSCAPPNLRALARAVVCALGLASPSQAASPGLRSTHPTRLAEASSCLGGLPGPQPLLKGLRGVQGPPSGCITSTKAPT